MKHATIARKTLMGLRRRGERLLYAGLTTWRNDPPQLVPTIVTSQEEYKRHADRMREEFARRRDQELQLIRGTGIQSTRGYCIVCGKWSIFYSSWDFCIETEGSRQPNWREHLCCPGCRLSSRMRATYHLFESFLKPPATARLYLPEQGTPFFERILKHYPRTQGSEFLGNDVPLGKKNRKGIRNEDITKLTFDDSEFDFVLNFEVMEHVPNYLAGFTECARILRPGGKLIFSAPFDLNSERNLIRARIRPDGSIEHRLPPEYHGTPTGDGRSLAFQVFGWELVNQLKDCGFASVRAMLYWSREYCYLGGEQVVFVAEKAPY